MKQKHATRTVLFDKNGRVAVVNVKKGGYYKIPGWGMHDISDGFIAVVTGEKATPKYEEHETARGFEIKRFPNLNEAISTIEDNTVEDPNTRLLQERDLAFLKSTREKLAQGEI